MTTLPTHIAILADKLLRIRRTLTTKFSELDAVKAERLIIEGLETASKLKAYMKSKSLTDEQKAEIAKILNPKKIHRIGN